MALTQGNAFLGKYGDELIKTANALVAEGKGILAADESTGTVGKRVGASLLCLSQWFSMPLMLCPNITVEECGGRVMVNSCVYVPHRT